MHIYGIPNCNTVKKSIDWLKNNQHTFEFHDFKKKGITRQKLEEWLDIVPFEKLINKKGTTWRKLSKEKQDEVQNKEAAINLMLHNPSVIKRPVVENEGKIIIGFDEAAFSQL